MGTIQVLPDPSQDGPKFRFNTGAVVNDAAVYDTTLPNIPGATSAWSVVQWSKGEYLNPSAMSIGDPSTTDPLYGAALYSWATPDGESEVSVYDNGVSAGPPYVYQLSASGGVLNGGGADLFLQADVPHAASGWVSLGHPVNLSMDAKISQASATYANPEASFDGSVLGQIIIGLIVQFNMPSSASYNPSLPTYNAFVQIDIANSQPGTPGVWSSSSLTSTGGTLDYGAILPGDPSLAWEASQGAPQVLDYSVNKYVEAMLQAHAGQLPAAAMNLSDWALTTVYVGLETESSSASNPNAGHLSEALQLSNLSVTTDQSQTYNPANPPAGTPLMPNAQTFLFTDVTTGVWGQVQGSVYNGNVAGLNAQYLYTGSDSMSFIAPPGSFIRGGPSNDAIVATGGGNVIDGGSGGSDYVVGGTDLSKPDVFFLDGFAEAPGQVTWATITNFHAGDYLTIWDYDPNAWTLNWLDSAGAPGSTGLTLWAENKTNGASMLATFNGLTHADITSIATAPGTSSSGMNYLLAART